MKKSIALKVAAVTLTGALMAGCSSSRATAPLPRSTDPVETISTAEKQLVANIGGLFLDTLWGTAQSVANTTGYGPAFVPLINLLKGLLSPPSTTNPNKDVLAQLTQMQSQLGDIQTQLDVLSGQISAIDAEMRRANVAKDQNTLAAYGNQITQFNKAFFNPFINSAQRLVAAKEGGNKRTIEDATRQFQNDRANYNREWDSGVAAFNGATFKISGSVESLASLIRPGPNSVVFNFGRYLESKRYINQGDSRRLRDVADTVISLQAQYSVYESLRWAPTDVPLGQSDPSTYRGDQNTLDRDQAAFVTLVRSEYASLPALIPRDVVYDSATKAVWTPGADGLTQAGEIKNPGPTRGCYGELSLNIPRNPSQICGFRRAASYLDPFDRVDFVLVAPNNLFTTPAEPGTGALLRGKWQLPDTPTLIKFYSPTSSADMAGFKSTNGQSLNDFLAALDSSGSWKKIAGIGTPVGSWRGIWTGGFERATIECVIAVNNGLPYIPAGYYGEGVYLSRTAVTSRTAIPGLPGAVVKSDPIKYNRTDFWDYCSKFVPYGPNFVGGALLTQPVQPFEVGYLGQGSGVNLREGANLRGVDLSGSYLGPDGAGNGLDLSRADLSGAVAREVVAVGIKLVSANLSYADLSGADLRGADLSQANLTGARFTGAKLDGARLEGANLTGVVGLR
jgi:outer membrane murein-binding lipoprotein Lpp